jgi:hypothetical protein
MAVGGAGAGVLLLFVLAPCCLLLHGAYLYRWQVVATTPVLTCEQLRGDSLPRVAVAARTVGDVISAPVSGEDCICYWTEYRSGTCNESDNRDTWLVERRAVVGDIVIEDGTGEAVITPELAERGLTRRHERVVTTASTRSTVKHSYDSDYDVTETREWMVRPGVEVFVIGAAACDGAGTPVLSDSDHPGGEGATRRSGSETVDYLASRAARWAVGARAGAVTGFVAASAGIGLTLLRIG